MAQPDEMLEVESPSSPSARVEGWVQYYEYFHKLSEDMQRTNEAAAQRRASPSGYGPPPPYPKRDTACFDLIELSIKQHDKPLVHIEDEQGADGEASEESKVSPGGRRLTDDDLALVRAQLRAAAQATNQQAAAQEDEQRQAAERELAAAAAQGRRSTARKGGAARPGSPDSAPAAETANTCAAAIETLVWFGLALGDKEKEEASKEKEGGAPKKGGRGGQAASGGCLVPWGAFGGEDEDEAEDDYLSENGSLATVAFRGVDSLEDLGGWDWEQAMREAGIDEEDMDCPPSESSSRPLTPQELSSALLEEGQRAADEHRPSSALPPPAGGGGSAALTVKVRDANSTVGLARFDSASEGSAPSDGTPSEAGEAECDGRPSAECDDTRSVVSGEGDVEGGDECDECDGDSSGRTTPRLVYMSPDNANRSSATRRSAREPKPQRPWLSAMQAPLLKWEKEQQQAKAGGAQGRGGAFAPKRRPGGGVVGRFGSDEVGFETDSGEELVNQLISPNECLLSDSVLDLVFGAEAKRQRC